MRVGEIQRARILLAMSELVRERGAAGVTVAHVVSRSGVSRRTFYELFADREACFLAAFDSAVTAGRERMAAAHASEAPWRERIRAALLAALEFLDAEPELGYLCVVGALSGGQRSLERRAEVLGSLIDALHQGRPDGKSPAVERVVAEGVVGAVLSVIHARLVEQSLGRRREPLIELLNPLMGIVVLPYLGSVAARRESARPAPKLEPPVKQHVDPLRELDMRLTYRTVRVLLAIASTPAASNREVASAAGITDQGQISKLLARLQSLGLIQKTSGDHTRGERNAWSLTTKGHDVTATIQTQPAG
ncbi:MAG TPA: TetR family transcriptional regulator [Solirubrobacteraceae bacterium]|jgi:AcrR family transcriptional regulator/DNA-binding MarR family transcriptional regulator